MLEADFVSIVLRNPVNRIVLDRLAISGINDAWLVAGALFQTAWNVLTGRSPDFGIRDYDVFYFDADASWDAEDAIIRRCQVLFSDVSATIEVRNQARIHLWYPEKFGVPYPPLSRATDGIDEFLTGPATQLGVALTGGEYKVYAPGGFDDLEALLVRPNPTPHFLPDRYAQKAARWKALWPELTILPPL
jgi:hypothetical protein